MASSAGGRRSGSSGKATAELLKQRSGQFDLASIQRVSLSGLGLTDAGELSQCTALVDLNLRANKLTSLKGIGVLPSLKVLDVSDNQLVNFDGIEQFTSLRQLKVQGNMISSNDALTRLEACPELRGLFLQDVGGKRANPVCSHPAYFAAVQRVLGQHKLDTLDGENLILRETAQKIVMETMELRDDDVDVPPSEPWLTEADLVIKPRKRNATAIRKISTFHDKVEEAQSLEAQAKVMISKLIKEGTAAAAEKAAKESKQNKAAGTTKK